SLERWHDPARLLPNLVRGTTIFVLACHPLFVALFGVGAVLLVRRRAWDALFFLVPTIAINYLFWLPNPSPSRHFMYVAPVLAAGVGVAVAMLVRGSATVWGARIAAVGVAASLVPASLLLAAAYLPLLQPAYPWKYAVPGQGGTPSKTIRHARRSARPRPIRLAPRNIFVARAGSAKRWPAYPLPIGRTS